MSEIELLTEGFTGLWFTYNKLKVRCLGIQWVNLELGLFPGPLRAWGVFSSQAEEKTDFGRFLAKTFFSRNAVFFEF